MATISGFKYIRILISIYFVLLLCETF